MFLFIKLKNIYNGSIIPLQNAFVMALGLIAMTGCLGYIAYMRSKYEALGYYSAVKQDGTEEFVKKKSKWDN